MVRLLLAGDVMTGRGIDQILAHPVHPRLHEPYVKDARQYVELAQDEHGPINMPVADTYIWGFALEAVRHADPELRIINLETSVTTSRHYWQGKAIHYRMAPENIGCLKALPVDCCTLANNHVLDWGDAGLVETLQSLRNVRIATCGAGLTESSARAPATLSTSGGGRILVFGAATPSSGVPPAWSAQAERPGVSFLPTLSGTAIDEWVATINAARRDASDIVVFSIHWGGNWGYPIPAAQREFARRLIREAGVNIVHGHSSHHVKGIEVYLDRLILYGCGDLITDYEGISGREAFRGDLGLIYFPDIDPATGKLQALRMQPTQMYRLQLRRPPADDVAWLRQTLNREGERFGTDVQLRDDGMLHLRWST